MQSLQRSLRQLGSDLIILSGSWEEQLPAFAAHVGAGTVITEQEVEWEWAADVAAVRQGLPAGAKLQTWAAPLFAEFVEDFRGGAASEGCWVCGWLVGALGRVCTPTAVGRFRGGGSVSGFEARVCEGAWLAHWAGLQQ